MARLIKKIIFEGRIEVLTGLHIGGSNTELGIGGPDSLVVRNPLNQIPYIPGSSLKGKMRALIEWKDGTVNVTAKGAHATNDPKTRAGQLFGTAGENDSDKRPSRIIVRDSRLLVEDENVDWSHTDMLYTESKTETSIDRITAKANPRTIERVPVGASFELNMVLNVFDKDDEQCLRDTLREAIELLNDDYLGGNGSRGYGHVKIDLKEKQQNEKV